MKTKTKNFDQNAWVYFLTLHSGSLIDLSDFVAKLSIIFSVANIGFHFICVERIDQFRDN